MTKLDTPITRALEEYGIDPMNTPAEVTLTHTGSHIGIDQFARDENGETILNAEGDDLMTVRVCYPHPSS